MQRVSRDAYCLPPKGSVEIGYQPGRWGRRGEVVPKVGRVPNPRQEGEKRDTSVLLSGSRVSCRLRLLRNANLQEDRYSGTTSGRLLPTVLRVISIATFLLMLYTSTPVAETQLEGSRLRVAVSILPLTWFVERIGGKAVDVQVLVGPGESPAMYEPTPKQMSQLSQADILFAIGVPFERAFLGDIENLNRDIRIVHLHERINGKLSEGDTELEAHTGLVHSGIDPHIWLDPSVAKFFSAVIADELSDLRPDLEQWFQSNLKSLENDLDSIDTEISDLLQPLRGKRFYVFHPAFGHFGERYGLEQVAIESEGKEPAARELAKLIDQAKGDGVRSIFVQQQFAGRSAETIASAIGAEIVRLDPLSSDYIDNLGRIARAIHESLTE